MTSNMKANINRNSIYLYKHKRQIMHKEGIIVYDLALTFYYQHEDEFFRLISFLCHHVQFIFYHKQDGIKKWLLQKIRMRHNRCSFVTRVKNTALNQL